MKATKEERKGALQREVLMTQTNDEQVLLLTKMHEKIQSQNRIIMQQQQQQFDNTASLDQLAKREDELKIMSEAWKELMRDKEIWGETEKSLQRLQKGVVAYKEENRTFKGWMETVLILRSRLRSARTVEWSGSLLFEAQGEGFESAWIDRKFIIAYTEWKCKVRRKRLARRIQVGWRQKRIHTVWNCWVSRLQLSKGNRVLFRKQRMALERVVLRMRKAAMAGALDRWMSNVKETKRQASVLERVVLRMKSANMAGALDRWHAQAVLVRKQREARWSVFSCG